MTFRASNALVQMMLWGLLLVGIAPFAYAEMGDPVEWNRYTQRSSAFVWGNASGQDAVAFDIVSGTTSAIWIDSVEVYLGKNSAPTDYLYGWLGYCPAGAGKVRRIATSTNNVLGSSLTTSATGQAVTFTFDDVYMPVEYGDSFLSSITGDYHLQAYRCAGVMRTDAFNATNNYDLTVSSAGTATTTKATRSYRVGGIRASSTAVGTRGTYGNVAYQVVTGLYDIPESGSGDCPAGHVCATVEEVASTTEAIYTVGYSIQLYLGIALFLVFLVVMLRFTRSFL